MHKDNNDQRTPSPVAEELARVGQVMLALRRPDQRSRAEPAKSTSPIAPEAHRNHHLFTLGGSLYADGFRRSDADAFMGLLSLPAREAIALLQTRASAGTLAQALHALFGACGPSLVDRGRSVSLGRRWAAYHLELEGWRRVDGETRVSGSWRDKGMSENQRHLVRVTAVLLDLLIPVEMNRGEAADWLERHGANLNYPEA